MNLQELMKKMNVTSADILYYSRWILWPFYAGLIPLLLMYLLRYTSKLFHLYQELWTYTDSQFMLAILHILDAVLVANLIIMIMIGGFVSFIRALNFPQNHVQLSWLSHVDAFALKTKLGLSLVGISSIHLLEAFVEAKDHDMLYMVKVITTHLAFVISAIALAWIEKLIKHQKP